MHTEQKYIPVPVYQLYISLYTQIKTVIYTITTSISTYIYLPVFRSQCIYGEQNKIWNNHTSDIKMFRAPKSFSKIFLKSAFGKIYEKDFYPHTHKQ